MAGHVPARCVKPSGRSLEPSSNVRPRGMAVPRQQRCGQNSAYRSGCHKMLSRFSAALWISAVGSASLTPTKRLNLQVRLPQNKALTPG